MDKVVVVGIKEEEDGEEEEEGEVIIVVDSATTTEQDGMTLVMQEISKLQVKLQKTNVMYSNHSLYRFRDRNSGVQLLYCNYCSTVTCGC